VHTELIEKSSYFPLPGYPAAGGNPRPRKIPIDKETVVLRPGSEHYFVGYEKILPYYRKCFFIPAGRSVGASFDITILSILAAM